MVEFVDFNGVYQNIDRSNFPILVKYLERQLDVDYINESLEVQTSIINPLKVLYTLESNIENLNSKIEINENSVFLLNKEDELDLVSKLNEYFGLDNYRAFIID
ncbi:MAG: hypothetical protein VW380_00420 [Candidatus Woesearchaeota archaeon]